MAHAVLISAHAKEIKAKSFIIVELEINSKKMKVGLYNERDACT